MFAMKIMPGEPGGEKGYPRLLPPAFGPGAAVSPGNLLEMQTLGSTPEMLNEALEEPRSL